MKPLHARIYQILTVLLSVILAALIYKFMVGGPTTTSEDGRTTFEVTSSEVAHIRGDMRRFLNSIQQINQGLANDDMEMISEAAKQVGHSNKHGAPVTLMAKLPADFRKLGFATHSDFDEIAAKAEAGQKDTIIGLLAAATQNCVACHEGYAVTVNP